MDTRNNINFKGIEYLKLSKKQYTKFGPYIGMGNHLKTGERNITEIKILSKLTNDKFGNDLEDFYNRLHDKSLFDPKLSDTIELHCINLKVPEDFVNQSIFAINGKPFAVTSKAMLPLMTFLARLTRQALEEPELSNIQKYYYKLVNSAITKEASEYIENRYL